MNPRKALAAAYTALAGADRITPAERLHFTGKAVYWAMIPDAAEAIQKKSTPAALI